MKFFSSCPSWLSIFLPEKQDWNCEDTTSVIPGKEWLIFPAIRWQGGSLSNPTSGGQPQSFSPNNFSRRARFLGGSLARASLA